MRRGHIAVGVVVLFAFSLTTEALAEKLKVAALTGKLVRPGAGL